MQDGLSSSTVYAVSEDRQGYLWFATDNGVNRFDGNRFEQFSVDNGLGDNEIFRIYEDKNQRLWFLPFNGRLSYYKNGKIYNETNAPFLKQAYCGQSLVGILEDNKGRLWIGSNGNYAIMIAEEKVRVFSFRDSSFIRSGVNLMLKENNQIEFRFGNKIYSYDESSDSINFERLGPNYFSFMRFSLSEQHDNFVVGRSGVMLIKGFTEQVIIPLPEGKNEHFYTCVFAEGSSTIWVGTVDAGVLQYVKEGGKYELKQNHLPDGQMNAIYKDIEGNLWFCTTGDGVYMLTSSNRNIKIYTRFGNYTTNNIFSVYSDKKGHLWAGGDKGLLSIINQNSEKSSTTILDNYDNRNFKIVDMVEDSVGNMWIATSSEIFRKDNLGNIKSILATDNVIGGPRAAKSITVNSKGEVYAAFYAGILKYNKDHNSFDLPENQFYPTRTFCVHAIGEKIFVGNIRGLHQYYENKLMPLYDEHSILTRRISCFEHFSDGTLIAGTNGYGVYLFRDGKILTTLNAASGLPSNEIRSFAVSGNELWIATDKGIAYSVFETDSIHVEKLFQLQKKLANYDIKDIVLHDSMLYAATSSGLVVLNIDYAESPHIPLKVFFNKFTANNINFSFEKPLYLKYFQNNISINFKALSYGSPSLVEYEYKVIDEGDFWKLTTGNEVLLSQLSPGTYRFFVRARIKGEDWGPSAELMFEIKKPFWETLLFRIIILALAVLLISIPFIVQQKRNVRNKLIAMEKQAAINVERQRISYDLHDDLGSSLTSIGMNTEIVKHKINHRLDFSRELKDIEESARYANEKMSDIIWAISVSNDHLPGLAAYINEFISDFEPRSGIKCNKQIQTTLPRLELRPNVRKSIFLTVKEAFHNILKHSGATLVNFEFYISDEILNIIIYDNGTGFNPDVVDENSLGLASMKARINEIDGNFILLTAEGQGTTLFIRCNISKLNHTKV